MIASTAVAQDNVHALTGTVTRVNPKIKTTDIATDDGSSGYFEWSTKPASSVNFDKAVKADAVEADKFTTQGDHVIVFFTEGNDTRSLIALRDLGNSPVEKTTGSVVKLDRGDRVLIIKDSSGAEKPFHLDPKTVADTPYGVQQGLKFDLTKGQQVMVTSAATDAGKTALLITPAAQ
jgi:hypothetical protein